MLKTTPVGRSGTRQNGGQVRLQVRLRWPAAPNGQRSVRRPQPEPPTDLTPRRPPCSPPSLCRPGGCQGWSACAESLATPKAPLIGDRTAPAHHRATGRTPWLWPAATPTARPTDGERGVGVGAAFPADRAERGRVPVALRGEVAAEAEHVDPAAGSDGTARTRRAPRAAARTLSTCVDKPSWRAVSGRRSTAIMTVRFSDPGMSSGAGCVMRRELVPVHVYVPKRVGVGVMVGVRGGSVADRPIRRVRSQSRLAMVTTLIPQWRVYGVRR